MHTSPRRLTGLVAIVASAVGFGLMPVCATFAYRAGMTVITLLVLRFLVASVLLAPPAWAQWRQHRASIAAKTMWRAFAIGVVIYTLEAITYFEAVRRLGGPLAVMLLYLHPAMVAAAESWRVGQRLSRALIVTLVTTFVGLALTVGPISPTSDIVGLGIGLAAAVIYVGYAIVGHEVSRDIPTLLMSEIMFLGSVVGLGAVGLVSGELRWDFAPSAWWWVVLLAVAGSVIGILFFFVAMLHIGTTIASLGSTLEAVVAVVAGALILHEVLSPWQYLGAVIVLSSAVAGMLYAPRAHPDDKPARSLRLSRARRWVRPW